MNKLLLKREVFGKTEVIGSLFVNDKFFCYTLEDILRQHKKYGDTAIPYGEYKVKSTYSNRFKRQMPLVWNNDKDLSVIAPNGDSWSGIRFHGGNTHLNTLGCILIAKNKYVDSRHPTVDTVNWIQGSMESEFTKLLGTSTWNLTIVEENPSFKSFKNNNKFWQTVRINIFNGSLTEDQVEGIDQCINLGFEAGLESKEQMAELLTINYLQSNGQYNTSLLQMSQTAKNIAIGSFNQVTNIQKYPRLLQEFTKAI